MVVGKRVLIDMSGRTIDRLTIISRSADRIHPSGKPSVCWLCLCVCGSRVEILASSLRRTKRNGHSCGCAKREAAEKRRSERKSKPTVRCHVKTLLNSARERAKKIGAPFDLTESDIVIPTHCPVLGLELRRGTANNKSASPSLDRIRPDGGYVRGNISVISHRANLLKNNATVAELSLVVEYMRKLGL